MTTIDRRAFLTTLGAGLATSLSTLPSSAHGDDDFGVYPETVTRYLGRLYRKRRRRFAFRADFPGNFANWQKQARPELQRLLRLHSMRRESADHQCVVKLEPSVEQLAGITRQRGWIESEVDVRIPFWLVRPAGRGPFPLAVMPHGHDRIGHDTTAGVAHDAEHRKKIEAEDRDVAVQAARRGFLAIAPATRGLATDGVPDVRDRHGKRDCRSHLMHCLLAGRNAIGERVWDVSRIIDWAITRDDVSPETILVMGNSGGGMVTLYAAACDERITIAVPSCSFTTLASPKGYIYHCDCNMVPGIFEWGDLYDVAGLIAPRHLLAVNGRKDTLHNSVDIERAAAQTRRIFRASGQSARFEHRWGVEGHRFYASLMWPFVMSALKSA